VADSREHAMDATEAVDVDYDELPVVTDIEAASADGAHVIHEQFGSNEMYTWELHNGDVDRVFAEAPVVVSERYFHPRLVANALEPRAVVVQPVPANGEFTVWTATQIPHFVRVFLTLILGIPETKLRVIAPEVGGGFGSKLEVYAEEFTAVALSRKLGVPIKWTEARSEGYLATVQGRGVIQDMEVAAPEEGKLLGVRVKLQADMGAYASLCGPGIPILGHQEAGGITEQTVRRLMLLQGTMAPAQIISLLEIGGTTFAMADHNDHIHVGFQPMFGTNRKLGKAALAVLKPGQWSDLLARLGEIENPVVPTKPSKYALPADKRASDAHAGE